MEGILALWIPIVLATVLMFVASAVVWMVLPHHKKDWAALPNEAAAASALSGTPSGQYVVPKNHMASDWAAFVLVRSARSSMGKNMTLHFLNQLLISAMTAYIIFYSLPYEAGYLQVFRVAGSALLLGYIGALLNRSIFWGWTWRSTLMEVVDGIIYSLLGAGVFGWWWVH